MFEIIYADEAIEQLSKLDKASRNRILKTIDIFEQFGKEANNSRNLKNGLW